VDVRVIERAIAEELAQGCALDFGVFDRDCLMTVEKVPSTSVVRLSIFVAHFGNNSDRLERYLAYLERLRVRSLSFEDFFASFIQPVNADFWNEWLLERSFSLEAPHGVSVADA
jgi:hypothetical protein